MIRQKTNRDLIDRAVQKEIQQLSLLIKNLAKRTDSNHHIQALAAKEYTTGEKETIATEVVFLTEKKETTAIHRIKQWIGIPTDQTYLSFFNTSSEKTIALEHNGDLSVQCCHFDHYPMRRKLSEGIKILKIIVYDPLYEQSYERRDIAQEILAKDAAVCIVINTQPMIPTEAEKKPFQIKSLYTQYLDIDTLGSSISELFENDDDQTLLKKLNTATLKNRWHYLHQVYTLMLIDIRQREQRFQGKAMLLHKKQWQNQNKDTALSSRDIVLLKSAINEKLKHITKIVDRSISAFEREDEHYRKLQYRIISFFGFTEDKNGKYINLKMAEGAVQDKIDNTNAVLMNFFKRVHVMLNKQFDKTINELKEQLKELKLQLPNTIISPPDIDTLSTDFLMDNSIKTSKSYEKQIPAKGIGTLFMELRTPLFMLMPFMMIFALFGALIKGEDEGVIDRSVLFHQQRPCIAITRLPESRGNENLTFIEDVEDQREKKFFYKEFSDELIAEPQLAVTEKEVPKGFGNKIEIEEEIDYNFDDKSQTIYLFLNENADRDFVIQKLLDPSAKLLSVGSGTRSAFGIGGIIKAMSGLRDYRYFILIGLTSLILWFIITRKKSMAREMQRQKEKEQKKINDELKLQIDKSIKQQLQQWKSGILERFSTQYTTLQQRVEDLANASMEKKKQQKDQQYNIIQKRLAAIKNEKTKLSSIMMEKRKIDAKLNDLQSKITRLV